MKPRKCSTRLRRLEQDDSEPKYLISCPVFSAKQNLKTWISQESKDLYGSKTGDSRGVNRQIESDMDILLI
jgi:hypothetical protein